jgi:hypothetical protein
MRPTGNAEILLRARSARNTTRAIIFSDEASTNLWITIKIDKIAVLCFGPI